MAAIEVIDISDSENEEEEKYITIFYRDSSKFEFFGEKSPNPKFIEFPVEIDGNLLLIDVKAIEPNIIGLYLSKGNAGKLLKPKNGFFKEPKEGWENIKFFTVLKNVENIVDLTASSQKNNARIKAERDELPSNIPDEFETKNTKKRKLPNPQQLSEDLPQSFSPTSDFTGNEAAQYEICVADKTSDNQIFLDYSISSYDELNLLRENTSSSFSSSSTLHCIENNNFHSAAHSQTHIAVEITDDLSTNTFNVSANDELNQLCVGTPASFSPALNGTKNKDETSQSESCCIDGVTDEQIFLAYNVSSCGEFQDLLFEGNTLFQKCFKKTFKRLRRTMIAYPRNEIIKVLFYASRSNIPFNILDHNAPDYCEVCNKKLTVTHVIAKDHIQNYQLKYNIDPPELFILLDPKYYCHFWSSEFFMEENIYKSFDFLINRFFPKSQFDTAKGYFIRRINRAKLILPSQDRFFVEKFLFLRENFTKHPSLKDIFPSYMFCRRCNEKSLNSFSHVVSHLLSRQHIVLSLTQEELNKIYQAISCIGYSDAGFYYSTALNENRKRRAQQNVNEDEEKRQRMH